MNIYIGADHRGFELKSRISKWLTENKYNFVDVGAEKLNLHDDYTLFAEKVASLVSNEHDSMGILLCGSGVGVEVVANKFDGARAAIGLNSEQVQAGRRDDDMNILVIAADFVSDKDTYDMLKSFLETKFSGLARHTRRLQDIGKIEQNN